MAPTANNERGAGTTSGAQRRAVALLNRGPTTMNATVAWSNITTGGSTFKRAHVRDLWEHKDLGVFEDGFTVANLASHATALLMVTEV
jgi:hypothetical protein